MKNSDLADAIAAEHGLNKADARKIVNGLFSAIADAASKALSRLHYTAAPSQESRDGTSPS